MIFSQCHTLSCIQQGRQRGPGFKTLFPWLFLNLYYIYELWNSVELHKLTQIIIVATFCLPQGQDRNNSLPQV